MLGASFAKPMLIPDNFWGCFGVYVPKLLVYRRAKNNTWLVVLSSVQ